MVGCLLDQCPCCLVETFACGRPLNRRKFFSVSVGEKSRRECTSRFETEFKAQQIAWFTRTAPPPPQTFSPTPGSSTSAVSSAVFDMEHSLQAHPASHLQWPAAQDPCPAQSYADEHSWPPTRKASHAAPVEATQSGCSTSPSHTPFSCLVLRPARVFQCSSGPRHPQRKGGRVRRGGVPIFLGFIQGG